jgi:DUF1365 family protein
MHRRLRPRVHALRYRIFSLLLDIDELDALAARLTLFSLRRFGLASFRREDVGDGSGDLRGFVSRLVRDAGLGFAPGRIRLLTMPRILGFAFNPLNTWFVEDDVGVLRAILYEVNNTFGERHHYLLPAAGEGAVRQACAKAFHVSPFIGMDMAYRFRVVPPGERLMIGIDVSDGHGVLLVALHTAKRRALTDAALLRAAVSLPFVTAKVVMAILWEALLLWLKRVPVVPHPRKRARG